MADFITFRRKHAKTAKSRFGMVSTASKVATDAGVEMLEKGGNAVDAAVASAFCLGVTEPQASGLGGQSMVFLHLAGGEKPLIFALDGSSRAPFGINPNRLPPKPMKLGIEATTVPSTPATLGYLLEAHGTLPLETVLVPSITAARDGFVVSALQHNLLFRESARLKDETVRDMFYKNGRPLNAGDVVRQPELAACLERMSQEGWRDFYLGGIGEKIIKDMEQRRGLITRADLSQIPFPVQRDVLWGAYRGYGLATFPPPGAGRALMQILNTLEPFSSEELVPGSSLYAVLLSMAFRAALMNSERFPMDPALYPQMADKWMVDKESALRIASRMKDLVSYLGSEQFLPPPTSGETTHLSAADAYGNIVGITQSIELVFGAKTMASDLGFFYNNYMSAFEYKNMMHPCYLVPGGRPWSSVAPTLLYRKNGRPFVMLGSPGSERISTSLAQVIIRMIDADQDLASAVEAPRLHAGSAGKVMIEKRSFHPEVVQALTQAGFQVGRRGAYSFYLGCVQAVEIPEFTDGVYTGVSDPRRDGSARGPQLLPQREPEQPENPGAEY